MNNKVTNQNNTEIKSPAKMLEEAVNTARESINSLKATYFNGDEKKFDEFSRAAKKSRETVVTALHHIFQFGDIVEQDQTLNELDSFLRKIDNGSLYKR